LNANDLAAMSDDTPHDHDDPEVLAAIEADLQELRRERRRLRVMSRVMQAVGLLFVFWVVYAVIIAERRDLFYALPSLFGTTTGVARFLVHKVIAAPRALYLLRDGDATQRERAWRLISRHRDEVLGHAIVPATIREEPLLTLPREALVVRLARLGTTDWRRILRVWVMLWVPSAIVVFVLTATFVSTAGR